MAALPPLNDLQRETLRKWMYYTIKDFRREIDGKKIGETNKLRSSFQGSLTGNDSGGLSRISLSFLYYGKFVELGVGRGTKLGDVYENKSEKKYNGKRLARRPKIWYSSKMTFNFNRAAEIMQQLYGVYGLRMMENELQNITDIKINL